MKKIIILFVTALFTLVVHYPVFASTSTSEIVETYDDGCYLESVTIDLSFISTFSNTSQKKGEKTIYYKNSSGKTLWSVTVHGTFSYNGTSAKCTSSSVSVTCPSSNWKISKKSSSKSGATATATASAKQYQNNSYLRTITKTVKLTCSKTGKFS